MTIHYLPSADSRRSSASPIAPEAVRSPLLYIDPARLSRIVDRKPDPFEMLADSWADEPDRSEYRFLVIGALAALLWVVVFLVARASA